MSDLISRSKLIMSLSDYALQESPNDNESTGEQRISKMIYDAIQNCISCVENQPTAYSVDKVVETLGSLKDGYDNSCLDNAYERGVEVGAKWMKKKAIEIVNQGCVGKEVE